MRNILIAILFISALSINAQEASSTVTEVVQVDSTKKDILYNRAILWCITNFNSTNEIIQLNDKENGKIMAKGIIEYIPKLFSVPTNCTGYFQFTFTVELKDNKYKYSFDNIRHESNKPGWSGGSFNNEKAECGSMNIPKVNWNKIKEQGFNDIKSLAESLKTAMKSSESNGDW